ncbi:hypothetical protein HanXRQr2_Chr03g0124271 [Helianthus annuus]|uniref:Uncharacterized protein n=1 Tax=Helianthus annuus TaxID=4232 RepID=A0A9K3JIE2_HELAN|nr:hypothetical protein HanXRQr2_Chr03g0124271 [Helianthus annuus]
MEKKRPRESDFQLEIWKFKVQILLMQVYNLISSIIISFFLNLED